MSLPSPISLQQSSGADSIPAQCYDTCNKAFLQAELIRATPSLCESDSPFNLVYSACTTCIAAHAENATASSAWFVNVVAPYLEYCTDGPISLVVVVSGSTLATDGTTPTSLVNSSSEAIPTSWLTVSSTTEVVTLVGLRGETIITSAIANITVTRLDWTGSPRATKADLTATPISATLPVTLPSDTVNNTGLYEPGVWVIHPALLLGSLAGALMTFIVGLLVACGWQPLGRGRAKKLHREPSLEDKPQLHSDHIPAPVIYELDSSTIHEILEQHPLEMQGSEMASSDIAVGEMPDKNGYVEIGVNERGVNVYDEGADEHH